MFYRHFSLNMSSAAKLMFKSYDPERILLYWSGKGKYLFKGIGKQFSRSPYCLGDKNPCIKLLHKKNTNLLNL